MDFSPSSVERTLAKMPTHRVELIRSFAASREGDGMEYAAVARLAEDVIRARANVPTVIRVRPMWRKIADNSPHSK